MKIMIRRAIRQQNKIAGHQNKLEKWNCDAHQQPGSRLRFWYRGSHRLKIGDVGLNLALVTSNNG